MPSEKSQGKALHWWQKAVAYQIYPASFRDSNGDGIGDLRGIIDSLDHLQDLGVKMIWLSPIYPSPMNDGGYDVADYENIDPKFGTLADFDELIRQADARGQRIIMDLVMNHSSSKHHWFQESASSKYSSRRNWYIWADPKDGGLPPNNWSSFFGGSAWTYDKRTGQYYLHKFDKTQPDLNLRNPQVRHAMKDIMRFWLNRGVGGFRMDVLDHIFEDQKLSDALPNPNFKEGEPELERILWRQRYFQYKEVYEWTKEVMELVHEYNAVGIAEIGGSDDGKHVGRLHAAGVDLPFNFRLMNVSFQASAVRDEVQTYLDSLPAGAWPNFVLGNHDNRRLASRIGPEKVPVALTLLLTLPGTPFIYYGEEIGMEDVPITSLQNKDPQGRKERLGIKASRDPARTPMQWDASESAGFSKSNDGLWLPIGNNREGRNVLEQREDPNSLLNLTKKLINLRQANPALLYGEYVPLNVHPDIFAYGRQTINQKVLVALNFSEKPQRLAMPENSFGTVLLSNNGNKRQIVSQAVKLDPYEGCIIDIA